MNSYKIFFKYKSRLNDKWGVNLLAYINAKDYEEANAKFEKAMLLDDRILEWKITDVEESINYWEKSE